MMKPRTVAILHGRMSSCLPGKILADITQDVGQEYEAVREYVDKFCEKGFATPLPILSEAQGV